MEDLGPSHIAGSLSSPTRAPIKQPPMPPPGHRQRRVPQVGLSRQRVREVPGQGDWMESLFPLIAEHSRLEIGSWKPHCKCATAPFTRQALQPSWLCFDLQM